MLRINQLLPFFEEESSNDDCASDLFTYLSFRFNEELQSIIIPENKFELKDISGQFF